MRMGKKQRRTVFILFAMLLTLFSPLGRTRAKSLTEAPSVELTEEEKEFVKKEKEIAIGCQTDVCPLIFQDKKTGELRGITIDILNLVSEATGLKFRYEPIEAGDVTYQKLQQMQVDLVASVEHHNVNQNAHGIAMTEPYLDTKKIFVCKKGIMFEPDGDMVIAVASGSQTLSKVIRDIYPHFQVDYYRTTEEALSALLEGKADAVLQNQYSMQRTLAKPIYEDLQIIDAANIGDSHCLAALVQIGEDKKNIIEDDTALLLSILNKGIKSLDPNEVSFIIIKETSENTYRFTVNDFLYRYRYAVIFSLIGILLISFLLWRIRILKKKRAEQVALEKKAKELSIINEQMEEQQLLLKDALLHAEEGSAAKSAFLFNMSHDIRTPMNAILGFTEIALKYKDDPGKVDDSLRKINDSGKHLLHLIDDILDMARIESGKVVLSETACNVSDLILKVRDILEIEIEKKKLIINCDVENVKNKNIYCDTLRMNQILFNLLSNAVKFSKTGGAIRISLRQSESEVEGFAAYELCVKDYGIGMSKKFQRHIFEPFERERTSTVSGIQGAGLGMSITKSLVDLMGGTIRVVSEPDKGTEYILQFIFKIHKEETQVSSQETEQPESVDFTGRRILLVEDNEINMEIAREILSDEGFIVETAENGKIGVDKVRESEPGYYDLVLMDIQMPVMDGYQAAEEIRRLEDKELAEIPIVALTANVFAEDKKKALASGMNAHVPKPIDQQILFDTLKKILIERGVL